MTRLNPILRIFRHALAVLALLSLGLIQLMEIGRAHV